MTENDNLELMRMQLFLELKNEGTPSPDAYSFAYEEAAVPHDLLDLASGLDAPSILMMNYLSSIKDRDQLRELASKMEVIDGRRHASVELKVNGEPLSIKDLLKKVWDDALQQARREMLKGVS